MKPKTFEDHIKDRVVEEHPLLQGYKTLDSFKNYIEKRSQELKLYKESLTSDDLKDIFMSNYDSNYRDDTFSKREMVYEASRVLHDTLCQFNLPINPKVSFLNVRDAKKAKNDDTRLVSGVVMFDVQLTSLSNVRKNATIPVNVISGQAIPPSVMEVDKQLYVVAQDAFDFIIERITAYELPELRTMFEPPLTAEEKEQAVALRNAMGWQERRNDGYLMQPTERHRLRNYTTPQRTAVKSTPPGFDLVLADLEQAEKNGEDTFPRMWEYISRNYIMKHVSNARKDAWMHHLINKGFVLNPYGPTNRGRKSGAKADQSVLDFIDSNPDIVEESKKFDDYDAANFILKYMGHDEEYPSYDDPKLNEIMDILSLYKTENKKAQQLGNEIFPPNNPEVISALANFIGHDIGIQQLYEDWTNGDSVPVQDVDNVVDKLEGLYQASSQRGNLEVSSSVAELIKELEVLTPSNKGVYAYKQAQGFPEDVLEKDKDDKEELENEPMEKEIEMEVSGEPEPMEEVLNEIENVLQKFYPGTKTPIEPSDKVKFNKGQRGCIVDIDAENDFLIVRSQGMEYRVKVDDVEPLPGTFKKMYM